ncbi:MAG: carboxypeptidase-like regulatory domain-containing protein [Bryobacteraceae bacterium]|jgi:hypothetical protein
MTTLKRKLAATALATVCLGLPAWCGSALSVPLAGSIAGFVRDNSGVPQMGATVFLMNRYERVIQQALTNERGIFGFDSLPPGDFYSIRVSLASFVPALKHGISVQPGVQSLLYINMASVLSSVELVYAAPGEGALMSDDWKWTLKSSTDTRAVMRLLPAIQTVSSRRPPRRSPFSDTRGLVQLSAGDNGAMGTATAQADLGTAFALATSLYGRNQLLLSGNVGYLARSGLPTAGFRTSWTRDGGGPEITVTARQISLPAQDGVAVAGGSQDGLPALRTTSVAILDHANITDRIRLDYGSSFDSISFVQHLNYFSPFARLTCELGWAGALQIGYSFGAPPIELVAHSGDPDLEMNRDLAVLASLPQLSMRDGRTHVQQTRNFEIGYQKRSGSRVFGLSGYSERVFNAAATMSGSARIFAPGDVLPDISASGDVVNLGRYSRLGFSGSATQHLGDHVDLTAAVGRSGVLEAAASDAVTTPSELLSGMRTGQDYWASARASAVAPVTGTRISASYEWMQPGDMMPVHFSVTENYSSEPGLNIHFRQPLPAFGGLPGRMEATADVQNLMAQGYVSLTAAGSQRVVLTQNPRALRGGVSFIF